MAGGVDATGYVTQARLDLLVQACNRFGGNLELRSERGRHTVLCRGARRAGPERASRVVTYLNGYLDGLAASTKRTRRTAY